MREIDVLKIKDAVTELCLKANFELRKDIIKALKVSLRKETNSRAKNILKAIIENAKLAKAKRLAICQDTGMVDIFIEAGQDILFTGGSLSRAINEGVRIGYEKGFFRKSIVEDPIIRTNTKTNTPAIIFTDIVEGEKVKVIVSPKGFGSENKSMIAMLNPTASVDEIKVFIRGVVIAAGADACPPFVLGVGIGGTFEWAGILAKKALLRPIDERNPSKHIARLEKELLKEINSLGIGPMGLGGKTTALGINILTFPTHIAGLPVAVNISCHATRSAEKIL